MLEWVFESSWYWLIAAALLLLLEIVVPGIFLMWLGLGAAAVGLFLVVFPNAALAWQLIALVCCISAAVIAGLKWQKKIIAQQPQDINQGLAGYIGRTVLTSINFQHGRGRIRMDDSSFPAICETANPAEGENVLITAVNDEGLIVTPVAAGTH